MGFEPTLSCLKGKFPRPLEDYRVLIGPPTERRSPYTWLKAKRYNQR